MPRVTRSPNKSGTPPAGCPLEEVLAFLNGAWTTKILWYLRTEPRRFGDLKRDLEGVSAKVLTTRLRELEERGVIHRHVQPTSPPTVEYSLTEFGHRFQPVLDAIVEVGVDLAKRSTPQTQATHATQPTHAPMLTQASSSQY
jgi:DNA-binding HxlR family transcriptional regulator